MDEAIDHIHKFGSSHTESIVTGACLPALGITCVHSIVQLHPCSSLLPRPISGAGMCRDLPPCSSCLM
jgi:hypothetical protein